MLREARQAICILLAAVLMFGGAVTLADSVSHAASKDLDSAHDHLNISLYTAGAESRVAAPDTGEEDPKHAAGHCLDAHCCAPVCQTTAQTVLNHPPKGGKFAPAATSDYVFTSTYNLLRPPRATA